MYRVAQITPRHQSPILLTSLTVVVGPNNAGKSQLLRDITLCASGREEQSKVLQRVDIDLGDTAVAFLRERVARMRPNEMGQYLLDSAGITLDETASIQYQPALLEHHTQSEEQARAHIASAFARELVAYLTTEARLTFSKRRTDLYRGGLRGSASLVEALFHGSNEEEEWISGRASSAFGLSIALDTFTSAGAHELRVAPSFSELPRGDRAQARRFMQTCERLDEQGDGLRSFVATLGAAKTLPRDVILIDQPEAFLHPPQAFQMGRALSETEFDGKQIICATHSADFLRGVISTNTDVMVIRVSRGKKGQVVRVLSPTELQSVAKDPVLSSGRVLDGIFYRQVIVTESDGDAVLYGALSTKGDRSGETYYVNSYSKQATEKVVAPYKHMGVPHAAIIDLDLIRVGPEFSRVAKAFLKNTNEVEELAGRIRCSVEATPPGDFVRKAFEYLAALPANLAKLELDSPDKELEWLRARLSDARAHANSWSDLKRFGERSEQLDAHVLADLRRLILICASAGLFLVPFGERESWLEPEVPYSKNKTAYTTKALEYLASGKLREDAPLATFMRDVHNYLGSQQ
jgi:hypothetical protein